MGKHFSSEPADDELEENHPSCMWGIIHALDYLHWHNNVKKMLPHKRHNGSRHSKAHGRPKARLNVHDCDEVQKLLDVGARLLIDPSTKETSSSNKRRSLKARIKALISEEMSKEENCKERGSGLPARSRLQRTYSIHHLEPSDPPPHGKSTGWSRPIFFLRRKADSDTIAATRLPDQGHMKGIEKLVTCNEKFNISSANSVVDYVEQQLAENHRFLPEKFEKGKDSSEDQNQTEANQLCANASLYQGRECADVLDIFGVDKDLFLKIQQDKEDGLASCFRDLKASNAHARFTKSGSFPAANFSRLRNFRPTTLEHKQSEVWSFPKGDKLFSGTQAANKTSTCHEMDGSMHDPTKVKPTRVRRASSANESLERYAQLLQNSFSKEAKFNHSKSLKVTNEYEIPSGGHAPISLKRVHSLHHLDSYCSLQNELSCIDSSKGAENDSHDEQKPLDLPVSTEKDVLQEADSDAKCLYNVVERSDISLQKEHLASLTEHIKEDANAPMLGLSEEMDEKTVWESTSDKEEDITSAEVASNEFPQPGPVSILRSCSQEDVTSPADFPTSNGLESKSGDVDEKESSVDSHIRSSSDAPSWSCSMANPENLKITNKSVKNHEHVEFCEDDDADFNYVSVILELSGFDGNSFLGAWHSLDQPLDPLVFEEVEACWPRELHCSGDEIFARHQLLFDLINEVLLQIYDSSFTYYPRELSSCCRIHPKPARSHYLEDVWARISRTLRPRQGVDQSVECFVAQDLGKDDGWMNLQSESECVALELEELIFDELLEEIIFS